MRLRVRYQVAGSEREGQASGLNACGAFVTTPHPAPPGPLQLRLAAGDGWLELPAEVLSAAAEGFAVAFAALDLETQQRLTALLTGERSDGGVAAEPGRRRLRAQGTDWSPPLHEPTLHQWRPATEPTPPPPNSNGTTWTKLPTRASARIAPEVPPKPEPKSEPKPAASAEPVAAPTVPPAAPAEPPQVAEPIASPAAERRDDRRHEKSIPVSFENLTSLIKEFTHNISFGGLFVYTRHPLKQGAETAVTLIHPIHGERLTLLAKVVHAGDAPSADPLSGEPRWGLGLEFRLPQEELKRMLSDFIGSHQRESEPPAGAQVTAEARALLQRAPSSARELLGVAPMASRDEVRRAYFRLVDRFHPDRHFGKLGEADRRVLEELFRQLTKAYEELSA